MGGDASARAASGGGVGLTGIRVGGFVGLVAQRLCLRGGPASPGVRTLARASLAALVLVGALLIAGERGPAVVASAWLAGFGLLVAWLIGALRPMLVVAVLGLALGVASLFVVLGVASGVEAELVASLARLNGHAMVSKYGLDFYEYAEIADRLEADPRVRAASPYVFGVGALVVVGEAPGPDGAGAGVAQDGEPVIVTIKGVDPERLAGFSAVDELFAAGDLAALRPADPRQAPGIVLGTRLARRVDVELGDRVRVVVPAAIRQDQRAVEGAPRHGEFEVLGLLDTGFAEFDASFVLMHITAAQAIIFGQQRASGVELELNGVRLGSTRAIADELAAGLDAERIDARLPRLYRGASWFEHSDTLRGIRQTKMIVVLVLSLIVIVASGSLLGALLLLVRRERHHIGVLAALGARPRQLFWVFELLGIGIGTLGSALGLAIGGLSLGALAILRLRLDPDIYMIDHLPVAFVILDLVVPSLIALAVCALVTGPVALRVSRIRPIALVRGGR